MATGRTLNRWSRVYVSGYDLSGYAHSIGPLTWEYAPAGLVALTDGVQSALPDTPNISPGALNGIFDNTASTGLHALYSAPGTYRNVMVAQGIRDAPAQGDPAFCGTFEQLNYMADPGAGMIAANLQFGGYDVTQLINYSKPWGVLLRPLTATTAVNSAIGVDDNGAATSAGGWMMYQVTAGNGTATLKVQDAATNLDGSFADLSGATSGSVTCAAGLSGVVAIGITATVRRYLRWQIVFGTATSVTFALAFIRR